MGIFSAIRRFYNPPKHPDRTVEAIPISRNLQLNISALQQMFDDSSDFTVKKLFLKTSDTTTEIAVITMEGLVDKEVLASSVTNPISSFKSSVKPDKDIISLLENEIITCSDHSEVKDLAQLSKLVMSGFAVILPDGENRAVAVGVQGYSFRSVEEPDTESVQRGSREGFVEPVRVNISMIRRRLRTPMLKFETMTLGHTSNTDICLCYMRGVVSNEILETVKARLRTVDLNTLFASGYLLAYLDDNGDNTLFPTVGVTERPDTACAKISEGRIVIIVDGTPSVLYVPHLMTENFQTFDDYTNRPFFSTVARMLKYLSFFTAILLPAVYVAFASYNPEFFPAQLLTKVSQEVSHTPFSVFSEVLLFTFIYEIMREAGLRLPKNLGHAVSIIGGLVIGDTAVNSGFIGAPTLMIVALTVICSYIIPNLYASVAMLRVLFILAAGIFGIWGVIVMLCTLMTYISSLSSCGIPFFAPISPFGLFTMRDTIVRASHDTLSRRNVKVQDMVKGYTPLHDKVCRRGNK